MLLKMYRYDMKNVSIPLLIVHGILLVLTALEMILMPFADAGNAVMTVSAIVAVLMVLTAITAVVLTNLLLVLRFYRRMFTEEGYLTNALPMTVDQQMLSHTLAYLTWYAADAVIVMGTFLALVLRPAYGKSGIPSEAVPYIAFLIISLILGIIASACTMSGLAHLSSSVGHLFPENKGVMTFIFYLVFGFLCQVFFAVFSVCLLIGRSGAALFGSQSLHDAEGNLINVLPEAVPIVLILFVGLMVLAAVMYFISRSIIKNHLNLA